jgi:hypothetical protein
MKVFRHYNVSANDKVMFDSNFFQNSQKQILAAHGTEELLSPVAGTRDEMPIAPTVDSSQPFGHGSRF